MRQRVEMWLSHWNQSLIHRIVMLFEPWGILLAVAALFLSVMQFGFEHEDRVRERTVRAWQLITTPASGNSGKKTALEYLNEEDGFFCWEWLKGKLSWMKDWPHKDSRCLILLKPRTPLVGISLSMPTAKGLGVYLRGIDLKDAIMSRANLSNANISFAKLSNANLEFSNLSGANLFASNLSNTRLNGASFVDANLNGAILDGAMLRDTNLSYSNLRDTQFNEAILINADLRGAKGIYCYQLQQARNWHTSYRDKPLACGEKIPDAPLTGSILEGGRIVR